MVKMLLASQFFSFLSLSAPVTFIALEGSVLKKTSTTISFVPNSYFEISVVHAHVLK